MKVFIDVMRVLLVVLFCATIFHFLVVVVYGMSPSFESHDTQAKTDEEFRQLYLNAQGKTWDTATSTPAAGTHVLQPIMVIGNTVQACWGVQVGTETMNFCVELSSK